MGSHRHWHGASWNYVIWGLYFFVLLLVEKLWLGRLLSQLPKVIQHVYTLFFVLVSWAIFALEDFGQLGAYLKVMFGMGGMPLTDGSFGYYLTSYLPILCVAAVASTNLGRVLYGKLSPKASQAVGAVLVILGWWSAPAIWWTGPTIPSCISDSEKEDRP